jgi:hypothetical protein
MKSRRGLSSVVGMVFAIIALTTTVAYVSYSMNTLNQFGQAVMGKSQQSLNTQNEKFQIAGASIANNNFNVTAVNTGNVPVNFTMLWVTNSSSTNADWTRSYPINNFAGPGATIHNIGQGLPISVSPTNSYNVKLVTSRGNSYQFSVNAANQSPVLLQLASSPSTIPSGLETTILLVITNNSTNNALLTNVSPNAFSVVSNTGVTSNCGAPTPASYSTIPVGTTVIFQWSCTISGNVGTAITYNATLQNGYNHNYALTTITVGNVQFASESTSSLSASGLSASTPTADNILLFDQNQFSVPYSGYQMYNTQADNGTNTFLPFSTTGQGYSFYTNNGTALTISPGKWNATLRYVSAPVPTSIGNNYPDLIYLFQDGSYEQTKKNAGNSIGNFNDNLTTSSASGWNYNTGVNNTGAWTFGSSLSMQDYNGIDSHDDISHNTESTAMWFKTSGTCSSSGGACTLLKIGSSSSNNPYYWIYINTSHHLVFQFTDHNNALSHYNQIDFTCTGSKTVDNGNWHFVVAVKTSETSCILYTDGSQDATNSGTACTNGGYHNNDCASMSGNLYLGKDPLNSNNYFSGVISNFMHWNNYQLTTSPTNQINDLLKTSYGANVETVTFNIFETNYDGTCASGNGGLGGNCSPVISSNSVSIPFMDGWGTYQNPQPSSVWGHYNYTVSLPQESTSSTQRIEFQMSYVAPTNGILPMTMIIDNTGLTDQWGQSLLEVPPITAPFMGYLSYLANSCNGNTGHGYHGTNGNNDGQVYIYNSGPNIAWVSPGSRAIFTPISGTPTNAYAGWMFFTNNNGWNQNVATDDSADLSVGSSTEVYFSTPYTQPGTDGSQSGTLIPVGNYKMYIYVNGYDDQGHTLLTTEYLGPVRVYYNDADGC